MSGHVREMSLTRYDEIEDNLKAYFLILFVPEVHRWISCFYFISLRQYRQWNYKNIAFFTAIEVIGMGFKNKDIFGKS